MIAAVPHQLISGEMAWLGGSDAASPHMDEEHPKATRMRTSSDDDAGFVELAAEVVDVLCQPEFDELAPEVEELAPEVDDIAP